MELRRHIVVMHGFHVTQRMQRTQCSKHKERDAANANDSTTTFILAFWSFRRLRLLRTFLAFPEKSA